MNFVAQLTFLNPVALWALCALPVLWFLFRAIPPAPTPLSLPTARFLKELHVEESTKASLPWWLRLLRMALFAVIILAASAPYLAPKTEQIISGDALAIVIENSWAAAPHAQLQKDKALSLVALAEQQKKNVIILRAIPSHEKQNAISLHTPYEARNIIDKIETYPWKADHSALLDDIEKQAAILKQASIFHWLGHGYNDGDIGRVIDALSAFGDVIYYEIPSNTNALLLKAPQNKTSKQSYKAVQIDGHSGRQSKSLNLFAKDSFDKNLGFISLKDLKNNADADISELWDVVDTSKNAPAYLQVGYSKHAGSVWVLPQNILKQRVGILANSATVDNETPPLIQSIYYISKAVEGKAPYTINRLKSLQEWGASLIIVPENYILSPSDISALEIWVNQGGTLLRFPPEKSGLNSSHALMPLELLDDERSIAGRLDWQEPLTIGKIPEESPLQGLGEDSELKIRRQVLAAPSANNEGASWALASDGTPLVSAASMGAGRIILIHTQAKPGWSNLPLTGFFINALHRIIDLSTGAHIMVDRADDNAALKEAEFVAYKVINAQGELIDPPLNLAAQPYQTLKSAALSHQFWPGIYRTKNAELIINLGDKISAIQTVNTAALNAKTKEYTLDSATNLLPYLIIAAFFLFILEWFSTAILTGLTAPRLKLGMALLCSLGTLASFGLVQSAAAQSAQDDVSRANTLNLAFVKTTNPITNAMAERGLEYVATALNIRTSLADVQVVGVDLEDDSLAFYPLLYWPFGTELISDEAFTALNKYINSGGMLFIDLRNGRSLDSALYSSNSNLTALGNKLAVPPLSKLPKDHVLRKSYYLLTKDNIAGRYTGGDIWLDTGGQSSSDSSEQVSANTQYVASLLIGSNDWIGLWSDQGADVYKREQALRFAINLVMYALTGTYKQDQVHTKAILDRLNLRQQKLRLRP